MSIFERTRALEESLRSFRYHSQAQALAQILANRATNNELIRTLRLVLQMVRHRTPGLSPPLCVQTEDLMKEIEIFLSRGTAEPLARD
ncbi:hypothetical protein HY256_12150 [Candidatus Sumerlaeota bacterium]|nr:hypothetical protein [Candidatus Sumerlaeota bacterium]